MGPPLPATKCVVSDRPLKTHTRPSQMQPFGIKEEESLMSESPTIKGPFFGCLSEIWSHFKESFSVSELAFLLCVHVKKKMSLLLKLWILIRWLFCSVICVHCLWRLGRSFLVQVIMNLNPTVWLYKDCTLISVFAPTICVHQETFSIPVCVFPWDLLF